MKGSNFTSPLMRLSYKFPKLLLCLFSMKILNKCTELHVEVMVHSH